MAGDTIAQGSQGPRVYRFLTRRRGEVLWAVYRQNLDGSEPRYYLSNAPPDASLETLAYVGGSRWRIETEFETEKSDVGLDEYETRTITPYTTVIRLLGVVQNPANGFPARPLDDYPDLEPDDIRACTAYAHAVIAGDTPAAVSVGEP